MVERCLDAAAVLAAERIEAEVIDLRSLRPLDTETIVASAKRTGRVLIVHEACGFGGIRRGDSGGHRRQRGVLPPGCARPPAGRAGRPHPVQQAPGGRHRPDRRADFRTAREMVK